MFGRAVVGIMRGKTPPLAAEMEKAVGEIEKGLVSRTGLEVDEHPPLLELLLSSSMVKLVFGDGERCFGERDGEWMARNPLLLEFDEGEMAE